MYKFYAYRKLVVSEATRYRATVEVSPSLIVTLRTGKSKGTLRISDLEEANCSGLDPLQIIPQKIWERICRKACTEMNKVRDILKLR